MIESKELTCNKAWTITRPGVYTSALVKRLEDREFALKILRESREAASRAQISRGRACGALLVVLASWWTGN